jgi:hypothetical protein
MKPASVRGDGCERNALLDARQTLHLTRARATKQLRGRRRTLADPLANSCSLAASAHERMRGHASASGTCVGRRPGCVGDGPGWSIKPVTLRARVHQRADGAAVASSCARARRTLGDGHLLAQPRQVARRRLRAPPRGVRGVRHAREMFASRARHVAEASDAPSRRTAAGIPPASAVRRSASDARNGSPCAEDGTVLRGLTQTHPQLAR